jgi:hypothetical protein
VKLRFTAKLANVAWVRCPNTVHRARGRADIEASSVARSRSHTTSPPSAPPAMRWSFFTWHREAGRQPRAVIRRHRLTSPLTMLREASKAATRGACSAYKGQRPAVTMAMTRS